MNEYDDSEDYSSANSFRARSNTWPLNRPDLAVPNGVSIDETLPEIELEEDDLFTTNENWATGLVDHDIMSWDPILNAQGPSQHKPLLSSISSSQQQPHHQQQQHQQQHHPNTNHLQHHQQQPPTQHPQGGAPTIHHHHQPQQPTQATNQRQQPIINQQQQHHQQPTSIQQHETLLSNSSLIIGGQVHQVQHQQPPQHQTLNAHCLDVDDPNDYHIQQLHHLRLDNGQAPTVATASSAADHQQQQQQHYIPSLSSMYNQSSASTIGNETYNISSDHQHHHLQPLTSARYDLEQNDLDLSSTKITHDIDNNHHQHHHQLHHMTSGSLDHHTANSSHMLSSSLSTSGIGLSVDLEDLDYKPVDPSAILQAPQYDDQPPKEQHPQQGEGGSNLIKQSNSTTSSKTKLNTPRRNAWGNMSYADLISQAINSTNDKRLTLSQIYDWMVQHVPYFKDKGDSNSSAGWKNSVRHNLSLHNRFKRLQNEGTGKSSWWTINPEANIGKCARRRAASMEASKYEKKRGRAKKRAEAVRQGLISYPSLTTNSSLNGSINTLDQQQQQLQPHQSSIQFGPQQQQPDGLNSTDNLYNRQPITGLYTPPQKPQFEQKNNELKTQTLSQSPPTTPPPIQTASQQQQQQQQQPPPQLQMKQQESQQIQVQPPLPQQVHHQMQKMEPQIDDSYYIHHDLHQDQNHHHHQTHHQQILNTSDHIDLFGRHAIYMSEPCNDCNCPELINCGTNAMSYT